MSDKKTARRRRTVSAVTTPKTILTPMKIVRIPQAFVFESRPTAKPEFTPYPLPAGVTLTMGYRLVNKDGSSGQQGSFPYDASGLLQHVVPVSREEYEGTEHVLVWATPYGHAAVHSTTYGDKKFALGRADFTYTPVSSDFAIRQTSFDTSVLQSVVSFIVNEMNQNRTDSTVLQCHELNTRAARLEAQAAVALAAAQTSLVPAVEYAQAAIYKTEAHQARVAAAALFGLAVRTGGRWDQKGVIGLIWGAKNRLGDSEDTYFYDIWSNMHFGYVGNASGFSNDALHTGSDWQNRIDHGSPDDEWDRSSIDAGFNLYRAGQSVSIEQVMAILDAHPRWCDAVRRPGK